MLQLKFYTRWNDFKCVNSVAWPLLPFLRAAAFLLVLHDVSDALGQYEHHPRQWLPAKQKPFWEATKDTASPSLLTFSMAYSLPAISATLVMLSIWSSRFMSKQRPTVRLGSSLILMLISSDSISQCRFLIPGLCNPWIKGTYSLNSSILSRNSIATPWQAFREKNRTSTTVCEKAALRNFLEVV